MELIDLHCNCALKDTFNLPLLKFYLECNIPILDFPAIRDNALKNEISVWYDISMRAVIFLNEKRKA